MFVKSLKIAALAATVIIATAGASMAATYAWVDYDTKVKLNPGHIGPTVNWVEEGQKVKIIGHKKNYYKVQIPGDDGWVHEDALNWSKPGPFPAPFPGYGFGYGGSFCVEGKSASFCLSGGY
jgi:uncharacterized protein YraI